MNLLTDHVVVRTGFVEVGDLVYVPILEHHLEVDANSLYLGSRVSEHKEVRRHPTKVKATDHFPSVVDRLDHLAEHDAVYLVVRDGSTFRQNRVVAYKDSKFVYLRKVEMNNEGNCNKVCRRTGKVYGWTPTGWDTLDVELRTQNEVAGLTVNLEDLASQIATAMTKTFRGQRTP